MVNKQKNTNEFSQLKTSFYLILVVIPEESLPSTPTHTTATVTFQDSLDPSGPPVLVNVPIRRCSSISKELANTSVNRDSGIASGATGSFSDVEYSRSPTYGPYPSHSPSAAVQSATDSLPLERFRPRSKSAHQSNALRQSKQLQKVPEVIQALRAPTAGHGGASEPSATDELYRSRLLRCNFLLKPDAAGYEYARRVQRLSHATYSRLVNSNNNDDSRVDDISIKEKNDELLSPFRRYMSKFYKKIYESHGLRDQQVDRFLTDDGLVINYNSFQIRISLLSFFLNRKYSSEQRDLDDADEDGNTVYRGLAVPVDIRQVVEVSQYFDSNFKCQLNIHRYLMVIISIMKPGLILFVHVLVEIQIPIKYERVVQLAHQLVPEVNFRQTFFY
jgi:hypothetical protein